MMGSHCIRLLWIADNTGDQNGLITVWRVGTALAWIDFEDLTSASGYFFYFVIHGRVVNHGSI